MNHPFRALAHQNFRRYWLGMCISLIGTWMQNIAQPWLAYTLTDSALLLSLVGAMQFLPMLLFSLPAGVLIDRFPKKKILLLTQTASLLIVFLLALLTWLELVQYWHILLAATALGLVNTLDMPTRQAFVVEMVGKEDLMNGIALNSLAFNMARVLGPALAGLLMSSLGVAACFLFNSISFLGVILVLLTIRPVRSIAGAKMTDHYLENIQESLHYIKANRSILTTILLVAIVWTFTVNFNVLLPVFSATVLQRGEVGYGFLMSFMGLGSLGAAFLMAFRSEKGPNTRILSLFPMLIAVALILTGATRSFGLTALTMSFLGFFVVVFSITANSTVQYQTEDAYRGRVMSVYTSVSAGATPLGNLYSGVVTEHFGPAVGFISCGGMVLLLLLLVFQGSLLRDSDRIRL